MRVLIGDIPAISAALDEIIESAARGAIASRGRFTFAVPGGSVASTFLPRLARSSVDWTRTDLFWVDERAVPPEDPESNYRQAHALRAVIPERGIHRIRGEAVDIFSEARRYSDELALVLEDPAALDVVLLGAGPDGHVASLFPERDLAAPSGQHAVAVTDSPKPPTRRVTLTMASIVGARDLVLIATGREKAGMIRDALEGSSTPLPASIAVHNAVRASILLDFEAGSLLSEETRRFWTRLRQGS